MDSVLLSIEGPATYRAVGQGPVIRVRNLGSAGEHEITVAVPEHGFSYSRTLTLARSEEAVVTVPLDIRGIDRPLTAKLEVTSTGRMPASASRLCTFVPEGWYDRDSPTLARDLVSGAVRSDLPQTGVSLGADSMGCYESLKDCELSKTGTGQWFQVTDPELTPVYGDGTAVDVAVSYMSSMLSRGYPACMVLFNDRVLVGVTDSKEPSHDLSRYLVLEPSAACTGVPLSVSKDFSRNFLNTYGKMLSEGKDYAFRSPGDPE